jgi:hypothetical protein
MRINKSLRRILKMKKFELGLLALAVLIGANYGSIFGIMIAICLYMIVTGGLEELKTSKKHTKNLELIKKEEKVNA